MPLILSPSFDEQTREQIESYISAVQARRMFAAIEYHQGKAEKLDSEAGKLEARIARQYDMLKKEIDRMEKAEQAVTDRLQNILNIRNELGLVVDMRELHEG
jgi:adenine specific DNA methylase Mod